MTDTYPARRIEADGWRDLPSERENGITYDAGDEVHDNSRRASGGVVAIRAYAEQTYSGWGEELDTIVGDMLGDLMHACDALGVDFGTALRRAEGDYSCELEGKPW